MTFQINDINEVLFDYPLYRVYRIENLTKDTKEIKVAANLIIDLLSYFDGPNIFPPNVVWKTKQLFTEEFVRTHKNCWNRSFPLRYREQRKIKIRDIEVNPLVEWAVKAGWNQEEASSQIPSAHMDIFIDPFEISYRIRHQSRFIHYQQA